MRGLNDNVGQTAKTRLRDENGPMADCRLAVSQPLCNTIQSTVYDPACLIYSLPVCTTHIMDILKYVHCHLVVEKE